MRRPSALRRTATGTTIADDVDLAVVAALDWEARVARDALRDVVATAPRTWTGRTLAGHRVVVRQIGVGAIHAARAAAELPPARVVALVGCAGGLGPVLRSGDLVLATELVRVPGGERVPMESAAVERWAAAAGVSVLAAPHAVAHTVLADAAAKRAAGTSGALVVEMEGWAVAAVARARGVPFVAVRAVLDEVRDEIVLPDDLVDAATGDLRLLRALTAIALRPRRWRAAARLARQRGAAERALRQAMDVGLLDAMAGVVRLAAGPGVRTPGPARGS